MKEIEQLRYDLARTIGTCTSGTIPTESFTELVKIIKAVSPYSQGEYYHRAAALMAAYLDARSAGDPHT